MSELQVSGTVYRIFPTEQKTATFSAREFVVEVPDGNYPQLVKFQIVQDRCSLLDNYQEGDQVTVHFDLRGREHDGKFFTNLNAWKIVGLSGELRNKLPNPYETVSASTSHGTDDDLPF